MSEKHSLAFSSSDRNAPAVRRLIRDYFRDDRQVDLAVAGEDDMYAYSEHFCGGRPIGAMAYFRAGLTIYDCVADIVKWRFGGFDGVQSFLDFAGGHGRFTRFLKSAMPLDRIWMSEILPDAVRFQKQQFGVQSLQSATHPDEFACEQKFDVVFVSSLFTHLPDRTFTPWLKRLFDLLTPGGLLIFSVHAERMLPKDTPMPESGIHFISQTEVPSLDVADYGATVVSEDYVKAAIQRATQGGGGYRRIKDGLCFLQDIYILSNRKLPERPFTYDQGPQGHLDHCVWTSPRELALSGWAADICPSHTVEQINIEINGKTCGDTKITTSRPDIAIHLGDPGNPQYVQSGWKSVVRTSKVLDPFSDVLAVNAICTGGKQYALRTVLACSALSFDSRALPAPLAVGPSQSLRSVLELMAFRAVDRIKRPFVSRS